MDVVWGRPSWIGVFMIFGGSKFHHHAVNTIC